jgi:hypothetical protein
MLLRRERSSTCKRCRRRTAPRSRASSKRGRCCTGRIAHRGTRGPRCPRSRSPRHKRREHKRPGPHRRPRCRAPGGMHRRRAGSRSRTVRSRRAFRCIAGRKDRPWLCPQPGSRNSSSARYRSTGERRGNPNPGGTLRKRIFPPRRSPRPHRRPRRWLPRSSRDPSCNPGSRSA